MATKMDTYKGTNITIELNKTTKTAAITYRDGSKKTFNLSVANDISDPALTKTAPK